MKPGGDVATDFAVLDEKVDKRPHVLGELLVIGASQPDVQKVALAKTPAVAGQVGAEEQLGQGRFDSAARQVVGISLELDFLGRAPLRGCPASGRPSGARQDKSDLLRRPAAARECGR